MIGGAARGFVLAVMVLLCGFPATGRAADARLPETATVAVDRGFDDVLARVEQAVERQSMLRIATASASRGAAARGIKIPGNAVVLVFRNDFAVRLLGANVAAGIEAPMRIYVTENADGRTAIIYPLPSAVLAPYGGHGVAELGVELDRVFAAIVRDAAGS